MTKMKYSEYEQLRAELEDSEGLLELQDFTQMSEAQCNRYMKKMKKEALDEFDVELIFDEDYDDEDGDQIDEFKADGEDSAIADPVSKGSVSRRGDKDGGEKKLIKQGSSSKVAIPAGSADLSGQKGGEKVIKQGSSDEKTVVRPLKVAKEDIDVTDDIAALFNGEEFSEDFQEKAATILQAAVYDHVNAILEQAEEEFEAMMDEQVDELAEHVSDYLDVVVSEYMTENELAIDRGVKAELAESFFAGLKGLFVEHYIDIPDEQVDIVDELTQKVEELEAESNERLDDIVALHKECVRLKTDKIIDECASDLTEIEAEKLRSLAEGVEYEGDEDYSERVLTIKDNYFGSEGLNETVVNDDGNNPTELNEETSEPRKDMSPYMAAISRSAPRKVAENS